MKERPTGLTIRRKVDLGASLKPEQQARLQALKGRVPIEYGDIPPVREDDWSHPDTRSTDR